MNKTTINKTCMTCNYTYQLEVQEKDLIAIHEGAHIQDAMPYLNADERELLISGVCGQCFDNMFTEEDEDE